MKKTTLPLAVTVLAVGFFLLGLFADRAQAQTTGIQNSYHNLSSTFTNTIKGEFPEVCIYCHTPHGGAAADDLAPLWNRQDTTATYNLYTSATFDVTSMGNPGSVSKACLSCHDGTVSVNALRNYAGTGTTGGATGSISNTFIPPGGGANNLSHIGTDLRDDHPISFQYSAASGAASPGLGGNMGLNSFANGFRAPSTKGSYWQVDGNNGTNPTNLILPLYGTTGTLECGTCHDPHETRSKVAGAVADKYSQVYFLRASNEGSKICLTCHLK